MNASDVSIDELQSRLVTFSQQLENVHQLLEADPDNEEFLQIAKDLVEVIRLTKEMIDLKLNPSVDTAAAQQSQVQTTSQQTAETMSGAAIPSYESQQAPDVEATHSLLTVLSFSPGTCCEAKSSDVWYPAYIESTTNKNTYNVHFLGFGTKQELDEASLRAIEHDQLLPRDQVAVGAKCEAKYYVDGQYYPCSVIQVTEYGVEVLFDGYGNKEEVPWEYLRALTEPSVASSNQGGDSDTVVNSHTNAKKQQQKRPLKSSNEPKMIKIPDHLQILPTDTEAEQERKRRRIRAINNLNHQKAIEIERNQKQQGWKAFQTKARKKGVKGASGVLSRRGESIFASPDSVNGRVGVVGSGQGMTTFQDTRKKFKVDSSSSSSGTK